MVDPSPNKKTVFERYVEQQKQQKSPNKDKQTQSEGPEGELNARVKFLRSCCYVCANHMVELLSSKGADSSIADIRPEWDFWIQKGKKSKKDLTRQPQDIPPGTIECSLCNTLLDEAKARALAKVTMNLAIGGHGKK